MSIEVGNVYKQNLSDNNDQFEPIICRVERIYKIGYVEFLDIFIERHNITEKMTLESFKESYEYATPIETAQFRMNAAKDDSVDMV